MIIIFHCRVDFISAAEESAVFYSSFPRGLFKGLLFVFGLLQFHSDVFRILKNLFGTGCVC